MTATIPHLIFLFGVAGVGKSFAGREISARTGYHHYELDRDLTPAIRAAIANKQPFTDAMRDEFFEVALRRIKEIAKEHPKTIFTQGAYKERHRDFLRRHVPELEFIWIQAPDDLVLERLLRRGERVSPDYAAVLQRAFEAPSRGTTLVNDRCSADELFERFVALF